MYDRALLVLTAVAVLASAARPDSPAAPRTLSAGDAPAHVAYSPDGKALAVGAGNKLRLYDASTLKETRALSGHAWPVHSVAFSPDGKMLASGAGGFREGKRGGEVRVWDVATGQVRHALPWWEGGDVGAVAFSPDGRHLAAGGLKGVRVWDATAGKPEKELPLDAAVLSLAFSPDGRTLAGGAFDQRVHLWDARTWAERMELKGHGSEVRALAFSPDGKMLVSGGVGEARVWDARTGEALRAVKHDSTVWSAAFSPDGKCVATGGGDPRADRPGEVVLWDPTDGSVKRRWSGEGGAVVSVAFSADGKSLAAGRYDGGVAVRDLAGPKR